MTAIGASACGPRSAILFIVSRHGLRVGQANSEHFHDVDPSFSAEISGKRHWTWFGIICHFCIVRAPRAARGTQHLYAGG